VQWNLIREEWKGKLGSGGALATEQTRAYDARFILLRKRRGERCVAVDG
jgi:hypothetical protein